MKVFNVVVDDGNSVFKQSIAAKSKQALKKEYKGNGDFIKINDVTKSVYTDEFIGRVESVISVLTEFNGEEKALIMGIIHEDYSIYKEKKDKKESD